MGQENKQNDTIRSWNFCSDITTVSNWLTCLAFLNVTWNILKASQLSDFNEMHSKVTWDFT